MKYLVLIIAIVLLISCKKSNNYEEVLEGRIWKAKSGETAIIYFQEADKTVYTWNIEVARELRSNPDFSVDDLIEPQGTPETNRFPDDKEKEIRVGWESVGGYKILNDTFYLSITKMKRNTKFYIDKAYDTLIKNKKYKAVQMYRYDSKIPKPVQFLSEEK